MNKILIVDSSASDCRVMSSLLVQAGYDPVVSEEFTSAQTKIQELPPGAVVLTSVNFFGGTVRALIDWLKSENYGFPVIAIVENINNADVVSIMRDGGAVDIIQRPALDKQLVETVEKYVRPEPHHFPYL